MRMRVDDLRTSQRYRRLTAEELPALEAYYDETSGNTVFIVADSRGREVVVDQFAQLKDYGHMRLVWQLRESGLGRMFRNAFEGMASVLLFLGDSRLQAILSVLGVRYDHVTTFLQDIAAHADSEKVNLLVAEFGSETAQAVHEAMKDALDDGVFTVEEWKAVQVLAHGV